ncbi:lysophospholipid acyltransferase family protein [Ilumatobacter sp.]|uniref:lysophospholipid acyltransferase family protein n=1 Tax=Ilumatobacter sp. TaxID=1967498 RepID=UPI003B52ED5F
MTTTPGAGAAQRRFRAIARPAVRRLWDVEAVGFDRLPVDGPAILCPNHISFLDSVLLLAELPRPVSFVGKAEYMDSALTRRLFPALGMIPIERGNGAKSLVALDAARTVLERGELFTIFPEGTRSRDGLLHKGRTGAARLALQTGIPVYPVGITGTDAIQPPGARLPRPGPACRIEVGDPIDPARYSDRPSTHVACRSMIDEVMFEIGRLSGRDYVHRYAGSDDRAAPGSAPAPSPTRAAAADAAPADAGDRARCTTRPGGRDVVVPTPPPGRDDRRLVGAGR